MKKLLLSMMLISAGSAFGAATGTTVSVPLAQKYDEILKSLNRQQKQDKNFNAWNAERYIRKESGDLLRLVRYDNSKTFACKVGSIYACRVGIAMLPLGLYICSRSDKFLDILDFPAMQFLCATYDLSCVVESIALLLLKLSMLAKPLDFRFNTVTSLSDFEWNLVEHLDVLMTVPYAQLSKEEKVMADAMLQTLQNLYPDKYKHVNDLRYDENYHQTLDNLVIFIANQKKPNVPVQDVLKHFLS